LYGNTNTKNFSNNKKQKQFGMNNNSRYYVPDVSEFHVNFEFEFHSEKREWKKYVFDLFKPMAVLQNVVDNPEMFRVKYLDEDDLIELGWTRKCYELFTLGEYLLGMHTNSNVLIEVYHESSYDTLFDGTIRNKSELRKVMAMLGIKKDSVVDLDEKYQVN
jgi:hypothetical protein